MLSDRAPGLIRRIFGDFAVELSNRLNSSERLGELTDGRTPGSDAIVHIGVWAVATALVGFAVWRWSSLLIAATLVFAASVFVEIGQGRYSSTRAVEMSDVTANGVGVLIGAAAAGVFYLVGGGLAAIMSRRRSG